MRPDEDENTGNGLIGILNLLDAIAEEGAAVMIVSHDKKGDIKSQDIRDRGAGSNWAARDVDCRFVMTPKKNDEYGVEVGVLASRARPQGRERTFRPRNFAKLLTAWKTNSLRSSLSRLVVYPAPNECLV